MILFINGPFGVGKTTVARLLVQKLPRAILYDPEIIGGVLHRVLGPLTKVEDYQDYTLWRRLVGGARLSRRVSGRTMVIPMTVRRRDVFDPLVEGLRRVDPNLWCFRLTAPRDILVVVGRISSDTEDKEAYPWRASHLEVCPKALRDPAFGTEIRTEGLAPAQFAGRILKSLPVITGWSRS
jgi:hypothetical protein